MLRKWFGKEKDGSEKDRRESPSTPTAEERDSDASDAATASESANSSLTNEALDREDDAPIREDSTTVDESRSESPPSRWKKFTSGLSKTRKNLRTLLSFRRALDDDYVDEIESELYGADFGPEVVDLLMNSEDGVRPAWKRKEIAETSDVRDHIKKLLLGLLTRRESSLRVAASPPTVILVAGVNGTGKTTSIAKLANHLHESGHKVVLAAADTFRAAAVEQLTIWSERIGVEVVTGKPEADPASVAYRGAAVAVESNADFLIVDTAGRLHTQKGLMRQLAKISGVLGKKIDGAPHESLMVLDATTGQNAMNQARLFQEEIKITGLVLAKLDGTAKGGIVVAINNTLDVPVKFVGLGEKVEDLAPFNPEQFVDALFEDE